MVKRLAVLHEDLSSIPAPTRRYKSVTPVPEDPTPSFSLCRYKASTREPKIYTCKIPIHIKYFKNYKIFFSLMGNKTHHSYNLESRNTWDVVRSLFKVKWLFLLHRVQLKLCSLALKLLYSFKYSRKT